MPTTENSDVAFESVADQLFAVVAASPRWQARRTSLSATDETCQKLRPEEHALVALSSDAQPYLPGAYHRGASVDG